MKLFLVTFAIFVLVILGMSLGYIIKRKSIAGSCGGISALGMKKSVIVILHVITCRLNLLLVMKMQKLNMKKKFAKKQPQFYELK